MKVFLTSSPDGNLGDDNGGSPDGYNNRNHFADRLRESLPEPVFFTMYAADPDNYDMNDHVTEYFAGVFERTGIHLTGHAVCDHRNPDQAQELLEKSGVIILMGGHVPTQNRFFTEIGLREKIQSFDGVVMGISAGTMNSADEVYAQPEEPGEATDPQYVRFLTGLNLTKLQILPHYQLVKDHWLDGMKLFEEITAKDSFGHRFYVLVDGSYIIVENPVNGIGKTTLFGEAYTLCNGFFEKFCEYGDFMEL